MPLSLVLILFGGLSGYALFRKNLYRQLVIREEWGLARKAGFVIGDVKVDLDSMVVT